MNQSLLVELAQVMPAAVATGLFVSLVTIQQPSGTYTASGAPDGTYANVSGLVAIQCMDAPDNLGANLSAWEKNTPSEIESTARRHLLLDSYYAALCTESNWGSVGWIAVVTNTVTGEVQTYDLRGAEADSQQTQSRLCLRKATV